MQALSLNDDQFPLIDKGTKRTTVRRGDVSVRPGPLEFVGRTDPLLVRRVFVTEVVYTLLAGMTDERAVSLGFASADRLREIQKGWHPDFDDNDFLTVVKFETGDNPNQTEKGTV